MLTDRADNAWSNISEPLAAQVSAAADQALAEGESTVVTMWRGESQASILLSVLRPVPRILVLGAGLDAEPVVRLIAELGWRASVSDHRPAYIDSGNFSLADCVQCVDASTVSSTFNLDGFDAVVVMSHHLATDETYLRQLAATTIPYIGLLGPVNRRVRLMESLGDDAARLTDRLYGPDRKSVV